MKFHICNVEGRKHAFYFGNFQANYFNLAENENLITVKYLKTFTLL